LTWTINTTTLVKRVQQRLCFLRLLKKFGMLPWDLSKYYRCTIQSLLTSCIMAWYRNCFVHDRKDLQRVVKTAQYITGAVYPPIRDIYLKQCLRKS
jgi:hypothetical protein